MLYPIKNLSIPSMVKVAPNITLDYIYNPSASDDQQYFIIYSQGEKSDAFYGNELTAELLKKIEDKGSYKISHLVESLGENGAKIAVYQQLRLLVKIRVLIDANYQIDDAFAAFWLDNKVLPIDAENRLHQYPFLIVNHSSSSEARDILKNALTQVGLMVVDQADNKTIRIVIVDDYLQPQLAKMNVDFHQDKITWLPLMLLGDNPLLGPIFNQKKEDYCYQCLYKRMKESRQIRSTIGRYVKDGELIKPRFVDLNAVRSIAYQFAMKIAKHMVLDKILTHQISRFNWHTGETDYHYVSKITQCVTCGTPLDSSATPIPFIFDDAQTLVKTSGGYKTVMPEITLDKYQHLVSPVSGVVAYLKRVSKKQDKWSYVYQSGNNIALQADNIHLSLSSVRMQNAGKGSSKMQAKASALSESIERYCCAFQGDEICKEMRFIDFEDGQALLPNVFMNYSDLQYQQAENTNSKMSAFHFVPKPIHIEQTYQWSPIWSIFEDKAVWVPTQMLYFGYPYNDQCIAIADTNGVAAGNSKTEAFVQAFLECIERDNVAIWWFNRLQYSKVDLQSFGGYIAEAKQVYAEKYQRKLYAIDISNDLNIPTFVVLSYNINDKDDQEVCFSAASHFDANIAMTRAVCEHNQLLTLIQNSRTGKTYKDLSYEFAYWLQNADINDKNFKYLLPDNSEPKKLGQYEDLSNLTLNQQRQKCLDLCLQRDWKLYVADFTRVDIGMIVLRVLVPELRSMHTRLKEGRLYDVPVTIGKLKEPLTERQLNPMNIFI